MASTKTPTAPKALEIKYIAKPVHTTYSLIFIGKDDFNGNKFRCGLYSENSNAKQLQADGFPTAETALQNLLIQFMSKMADEDGELTTLGHWAKIHPLAGLSTQGNGVRLPLRALKIVQALMGLMPPDEGMELPTL